MEHGLNMSSKLSHEHSAREGTFLITHSVNFSCRFFLEIVTRMRRRNEGIENAARKGAFRDVQVL